MFTGWPQSWKTWKSQGIKTQGNLNFAGKSGKLRETKKYVGNDPMTMFSKNTQLIGQNFSLDFC